MMGESKGSCAGRGIDGMLVLRASRVSIRDLR